MSLFHMSLFHSISHPFSLHLLNPTTSRHAFSTSQTRAPAISAKAATDKKGLCKAPRRPPRRVITISTSDGRYHGEWSCDYVFSLREIHLADLAEEGHKDAQVYLNLSVHKHAGFGFSVDGRIITSFNRKCTSCLSSYCREIDTTFNVWVLPSSKSNELQLPEIGGSDPSVIYVKPGSEADLDSFVQDTIRLTASAKDTCSESCEKSVMIWQYTDGTRSYDQRWSRLLEIKNVMSKQGVSAYTVQVSIHRRCLTLFHDAFWVDHGSTMS